MNLTFTPHVLKFIKPGGTSRGILTEKPSHLLSVPMGSTQKAIGEISTIPGLSIDKPEITEKLVKQVQQKPDLNFWLNQTDALNQSPALKFAVEMLWLNLKSGENQVYFDNDFTRGKDAIAINGLVWMGEPSFMQSQIAEKLAEGFKCIKLKIGAIDFETELSLLKSIRAKFSAKEITIRVDANGAFSPQKAPEVLKQLAELEIHSIEQPIKDGQWQEMAALCEKNIIPIALDEELIGVFGLENKRKLIETINPQYLIFKPSLLGGFTECNEWISLCKKFDIGYWNTSALESNYGLNAIAQYTFQESVPGYQGLGTGKLFSNNFESNLKVEQGFLWNR